jgi:hypothetical protein
MKQYLILIEQLVRDGKSEAEIEAIVEETVADDAEALDAKADDGELPRAA